MRRRNLSDKELPLSTSRIVIDSFREMTYKVIERRIDTVQKKINSLHPSESPQPLIEVNLELRNLLKELKAL